MAERSTLCERMAQAGRDARSRSAFARAAAASAPDTRAAAADHEAGPAWQVPGQVGQHLVLMPGQMHFGNRAASVRTLLGSCVAVTLWHPGRRLGGMCHYLLPSRHRAPQQPSDGRYGDEALAAMVEQIRLQRAQPSDFHAHLYGGADTMPEGVQLRFNVGERNIEQGWRLIDHYGFQLQGVDVGEDVPRTVTLNCSNGAVEMKRGQGQAPRYAMPGLNGLKAC